MFNFSTYRNKVTEMTGKHVIKGRIPSLEYLNKVILRMTEKLKYENALKH